MTRPAVKFVALFRGINVGGRNKLSMKDLVPLLQSMGLKNVRTYIQSGNVVFEASRSKARGLARKIQDTVADRHGFRPELLILDEAELDDAISQSPFPEADAEPQHVHVMFLSTIPGAPDLEVLERLRAPGERYALKGRTFHLHAPDGIGRSKLAARIEKSLGVFGTSRNWRTVRKLREMMTREK